MKYGRGKWVFGAFVLAARDAARRFTFGHGSAARCRGSWRPLVLQWRRRRRLQEKLLAGGTATATPNYWFPQFHFHYATHLSTRSPRNRSLSSSPAVGGAGTRIVLDHHWSTIRTAELTEQPRHDSHPLRPFYAPQSWPQIDGGSTNAPGRSQSPGLTPIVPQIPRRPFALQFGTGPRGIHAKGKTEERAQPFQTQSRIRQHWLSIFRVRQPALAYRLPHRSAERNSARVTFNEPEELVWRRANRPPTEVADLERNQATPDFHSPAVRTFQSQEVAHLPRQSERVEALQITKLDPGFLDRLTDDVISRVEKRARIERQRRGL